MDIDRYVISRIVEHEEMTQALDEGLAPELFEGQGRQVWDWLVSYFRKYGRGAGSQALSQRFPDYLEPVTEPLPFYTDQLRQRFAYNTAMQAMKDGARILREDGDPRDALESMRTAVRLVDDLATQSDDVDWTKTGEKRILHYEQLQQNRGIDGIPSLFPSLDMATQGFHAEDLVFIVARQGVGKTWAEVILSHHNWLMGYKPILFSKEMSAHQICRRLDAAHSKLPYQELRSGQLDSLVEQRYRQDMASLRDAHPFMVIGQEGGGVSLVEAKIERYQPDIVYIDGMYLMEDERRAESNWLRITNIARDLKRVAKRRKLPIVVSLQFSKEASRTRGGAANIALADIAKEADLIFGLFQSEDQRLSARMTWRILKQREGPSAEMELVWDMDRMEFSEVGSSEQSLQELESGEVAF